MDRHCSARKAAVRNKQRSEHLYLSRPASWCDKRPQQLPPICCLCYANSSLSREFKHRRVPHTEQWNGYTDDLFKRTEFDPEEHQDCRGRLPMTQGTRTSIICSAALWKPS